MTLSFDTHPHWSGRSIYRCVMELFRFIFTTIFIANASSSPFAQASIIVNYRCAVSKMMNRKQSSSEKAQDLVKSSSSTTSTSSSTTSWGGEASTINLWNVRSYSSLSIPAAVTPSSSRSKPRSRRSLTPATVVTSSSSTPSSLSTTTRFNTQPESSTTTPSLEELRAQLGPVGRLIANSVEVGVTAAGSYLTGGIFGYFLGGVANIPTFFQSPPLRNFNQNIHQWNTKAMTQAKSWAQLSAAFSGFHAFTRVARGGVEDKWNNIIGSALTGAYMSRAGGPPAMIQSASSYAGLTYLMDLVFQATDRNRQSRDMSSLDFHDTPISTVDDRGF